MSVNFPSSPSTGTVYISGERAWRWTGTYWRSISTDIGYTGSLGYTGSQGYTGSIGFTGSEGPIPENITFTATYITLDPQTTATSLVSNTSTVYGTYLSGDITGITTYGDYGTGGYFELNDQAGVPGFIVYVGFENITEFNRITLNINYTQNSGHTIEVDLFNYATNQWDAFGNYTGLTGYYNFALQVIDSSPYISTVNTGTVSLRLYHISYGNPSHLTRIDYVALERSVQGGQGPKGQTGAQGYSGSVGYTGSAGPVASTRIFTCTNITLDPTQIPVSGTATTYGSYSTGTVSSLLTFGDYVSAGGYWAANDSNTVTPGLVVYAVFENVDRFNKIVANLLYSQTATTEIEIDIYNFTANDWDNFAAYGGLNQYTNLSLGVIGYSPYIQTGTVYLKIHHNDIGTADHQIRIDYLALENAVEGPQGPQGSLGYTGSTGFVGSTGYVGSVGDKAGVKYQFDTGTGVLPPNGYVRYNNAFSPNNVSSIYVSTVAKNGFDYSSYFSSFTATVGLYKGTIVLTGNDSTSTVQHIYRVSTVTDNVTFYTLNVGYLAGSSVLPNNNSDLMINVYNQGNEGYTGSKGTSGDFAAQGYTGSLGSGFTGSTGQPGTSVTIKGTTSTFASLPAGYTGAIGDGYIVGNTGNLAVWGGSVWTDVGRIIGYTGSAGSAGGYTGSAGYTGSPGTLGYTGSRGIGYTGSPGVGVGLYDKHFNYPGNLGIYAGTARWYSMNIQTISKVTAYVSSAPVGASLGIRVRKNGESTATITISDGGYTSSINTNIVTTDGEYITVDLFQVGTSSPGSDLVVSFLYTRAGS